MLAAILLTGLIVLVALGRDGEIKGAVLAAGGFVARGLWHRNGQ